MKTRKISPIVWRALLAAALASVALSLPGCHGASRRTSAWAEPPTPGNAAEPRGSASAAVVLLSDAEREYEAGIEGTQPHQRFEFARRDYLLSRRVQAPILATNEWPVPYPNRERPVWFHIWRQ